MVTLALLSALYPFAAFGVTPLGSKTATRFSVFVRLRDRTGGREDARTRGWDDGRIVRYKIGRLVFSFCRWQKSEDGMYSR